MNPRPLFSLLLAFLLALLLAGLAAASGSDPAMAPRLAPPAPVNITFDSDVWSVAVQDNYAFVGLEKGDVTILDITNPLHPTVVSTFDDPDSYGLYYVDDLIPNGDILVIPVGSVFYIVDISDPAHPSWLSYRHPAAYTLKAMALYDRRAYGLGRDSFEIWDLQDPASPQLLYSMYDERHQLFSYMMAIAVSRNPADGRIYAYMTGEPYCFPTFGCVGNGLVFMDVTDPTQPQTVYTSTQNGTSLLAQEQYLFWSSWGGNLEILDLSDSQHPLNLSATMQGNIYDMDLVQNNLYMALGYGEAGQVRVLDVSDKASPATVAFYDDVQHWMSLAYSEETGCLFVAELSRGLRILCDINANPQPPALVWLPLIESKDS